MLRKKSQRLKADLHRGLVFERTGYHRVDRVNPQFAGTPVLFVRAIFARFNPPASISDSEPSGRLQRVIDIKLAGCGEPIG